MADFDPTFILQCVVKQSRAFRALLYSRCSMLELADGGRAGYMQGSRSLLFVATGTECVRLICATSRRVCCVHVYRYACVWRLETPSPCENSIAVSNFAAGLRDVGVCHVPLEFRHTRLVSGTRGTCRPSHACPHTVFDITYHSVSYAYLCRCSNASLPNGSRVELTILWRGTRLSLVASTSAKTIFPQAELREKARTA